MFAFLDGGAAESQVGYRRDQGDTDGKCQASIPGRGGDGDGEVPTDRIAQHEQRLRVRTAVRDKPVIGRRQSSKAPGKGVCGASR